MNIWSVVSIPISSTCEDFGLPRQALLALMPVTIGGKLYSLKNGFFLVWIWHTQTNHFFFFFFLAEYILKPFNNELKGPSISSKREWTGGDLYISSNRHNTVILLLIIVLGHENTKKSILFDSLIEVLVIEVWTPKTLMIDNRLALSKLKSFGSNGK